jgi:hypothetical protein
LSQNTFVKMWNRIQDEDPSAQILSAWIAKEELRTLLSTVRVGGDAHLTRHRLHQFLTWCIDSQIPELLTLAATVDHWWPEINAFVTTGITNARTEGYNRLLKQVKRSDADSGIETTRHAGYDSTAPANSGPQPRLQADCPVKIEEPQKSALRKRSAAESCKLSAAMNEQGRAVHPAHNERP